MPGEKHDEEEEFRDFFKIHVLFQVDYSGRKKHEEKKDSSSDVHEPIELPGGLTFHRLPHKDGKDKRVGNPLAKDFLSAVRQGVLATETGSGLADKVLMLGRTTSYWRSNHDRVKGQMLVPKEAGQPGDCLILPQLVTAGTLTRRAVERTWLTASNAKKDRIGSELKTLVEAPEGFHLVRHFFLQAVMPQETAPNFLRQVGADVDSQELWIAAVLGDASHPARAHGCTPLGWMTLRGSKAEGTDLHSLTAKTTGVTRDEAKVQKRVSFFFRALATAEMFDLPGVELWPHLRCRSLLRQDTPAEIQPCPHGRQCAVKMRETPFETIINNINVNINTIIIIIIFIMIKLPFLPICSRLSLEMYAKTKGERVYVLNKLGALCLAGKLEYIVGGRRHPTYYTTTDLRMSFRFSPSLRQLRRRRSRQPRWHFCREKGNGEGSEVQAEDGGLLL